MTDLTNLCISPDAPLRQVLACIDANARGFALLVGADGRLFDTVTDGDLRRAVMAGMTLDEPVRLIVERRPPAPHPTPLVARVGTSEADLLHLMSEYTLRHIPIVDDDGCVQGVALLSELVKEYELPLQAVIMAGGFGARLRPLTDDLPKPMLPLGGRPLLQHIIEGLRAAGIRRMNVTTHYKGDVITRHFGDGRDFGVEIDYVEERQPLGTAGALRLVKASSEPLLVVNGDVLTDIDIPKMLAFHRQHDAAMTVAVREHRFEVPYGVLQTDGERLLAIQEKPTVAYTISAGVYLLSPETCSLIPDGQSYDMPDLIRRVLEHGDKVVTFPVDGYWRDVGHHSDYEQARLDRVAGLI